MGLFWFIVLVGICGLAVDTTDAFRTQTMLQSTADAAAHAAILDLPDEAAAVASALEFAELNMPGALYGAVLDPADVELGVWDPGTRTFSADTPANAVRVTTRRAEANANPLDVNFLRIIGLTDWDIAAQAVAMAGIDNCLRNGFIAAGNILSGSENDYVDKICIHGQLGVKIGSTNFFEQGVEVTMLDLDTFVQSQDNDGIDDALGAQDLIPPLPAQVPSIISGLSDGSLSPPSFIHLGVIHAQYLPANPIPHTLYIVDEVVDFGSDAQINNLAVVSQ